MKLYCEAILESKGNPVKQSNYGDYKQILFALQPCPVKKDGSKYYETFCTITGNDIDVVRRKTEIIKNSVNHIGPLLDCVTDFILDCDNGLGSSVDRLRNAVNSIKGAAEKTS